MSTLLLIVTVAFAVPSDLFAQSATSIVLTSSATVSVSASGSAFSALWTASGGTGNATITTDSAWLTVQCGIVGTPDTVLPNGCTTANGPGVYGRAVIVMPYAGTRVGIVSITGANGGNTVTITVTQSAAWRPPFDFDADSSSDIVVWRPDSGVWYVKTSSTTYAGSWAMQWGLASLGDVPVAADYDGDHGADIAVWRASTGMWYVKESSSSFGTSFSVQWGAGSLGDVPIPADFDGDGKADIAVWRPSDGTWYVRTSTTNYSSFFVVQWGAGNLRDVPIAADFDGDGKADIAVWRPDSGMWYVKTSASGYGSSFAAQWGAASAGDIPIAGDFDGDGRADLCVWRPGPGMWYVKLSTTGYSTSLSVQWGAGALGDVPVIADFDGDRRTDIAVWRPDSGTWYVKTSGSSYASYLAVQWGAAYLRDTPIGAAQRVSAYTPPPPPPPAITFGPGLYLVGIHVPAGRYFSDPASGCYWERLSGLGGTVGEILANEFVDYDAGQWIVDIRSSDKAFNTEQACGTWSQVPRVGPQPNIAPGVWLVGSQIPPGTYMANASYGCYWERRSNFDGTLSAIIANEFVTTTGPQSVQISSSDAGFLSAAECGVWTRIGSLTSPMAGTSDAQSSSEIQLNWEAHRRKSGVRY